MKLYEDGIFHIYNQGNNKRQIFFEEENYEYFIYLLRCCVLPYGTFIAWCLMPNHFHLLFQVDRLVMDATELKNIRIGINNERKLKKYGHDAILLPFIELDKENTRYRSLNQSIGILSCTYAKAINKRYGWSGSIFRNRCKAKDGWDDALSPNDITNPSISGAPYDYVDTCFNYIHNNPVIAAMTPLPEDYKWSSAKTYANGIYCPLLIDDGIAMGEG